MALAPDRGNDEAVLIDPQDRVLGWQDELERVGPRLNELPAPARQAVLATVAAFLSEDAERWSQAVLELLHRDTRPFADAA